ncbi:MAG: glutamate mutase L [Bdellovibrionales bacterium]|nr:glutamate mutase L [Bdellovibrionales bacterium]
MTTLDKEKIKRVLVTDCGSTTTKALLFEKTDGVWRQSYRGEAPTTVEKPTADVTIGALNAFSEIQELSSYPILNENFNEGAPFNLIDGIDLYLSTSSAGGGLQMIVAGLVKTMTTESAERAALGAGAIVLDAISADDGREDFEKIERIRHLRPDIVLLTGGIDGGDEANVIESAEILLAAKPLPRFGDTLKLPVIFAGNNNAAKAVKEILSEIANVSVVENVRPKIDQENLGPAREAIHEFFLTHVMSHSPGYGKLISWTPVPVMPTPAAVGDMVQQAAKSRDCTVLCADIGGATTDVFSVFNNEEGKPVFNRTVSANLGMSYSIANVLVEAGVKNIARWLPYTINESDLRDRLRNKMIRPTSIPQTLEDLWLEQAVCREALRLSLDHHRMLAVGLSGVQRQRSIADIFSQHGGRYELVDMMKLDLVIGSGGVLSHAPNRISAALMMLDGFNLMGLTEIAVDSIFMMPHLGVFASVHPEAANEIFENDCIVKIAYAIVPVASKITAKKIADIFFNEKQIGFITAGQVEIKEFESGISGKLKIVPSNQHVNLGAGYGEVLEKDITTSGIGFIFDGRNRPLSFSEDIEVRAAEQKTHYQALGLMEN